MKKQVLAELLAAVARLGLAVSAEDQAKIKVEYPEPALGDLSSNVALILAKAARKSPPALAQEIVAQLDRSKYSDVSVAGPGFINFRLSDQATLDLLTAEQKPDAPADASGKILVEYFQPNIAKPLHIGHLRTAVIGDALARMLKYLGYQVESDTHMGDWGTQFGLLILAYRKYGNEADMSADPIAKLNEYYVKINQDAEKDPAVHEAGKAEFVKLEQGDADNRQVWQRFVDWSMERFLAINDLMDILPFDHHWPESFYQDKMPAVLDQLKAKGLLVESQGAQIVNLEEQGLGIAVIVKSDGGTTYLLRDLATFIHRKNLGFAKQLYVVDNRQSHAFFQMFAILGMLGEYQPGEGAHIDYGFISFKGEALSTRKGNMVLAADVIAQAEEKVAAVIQEKNPDLAGKAEAIKTVAKGALKYYDLSHNRHSDIEFDWAAALDFEGNSGPYLQYTYARLSSILRKVGEEANVQATAMPTLPVEHQLALESAKLPEVVGESAAAYMPNTLAGYLFSLASLANKFYHECPVAAETDLAKKAYRLALVKKTRATLKQGLDLLGIKTLEEM